MRIAVNLRQYYHGRIGGLENYLVQVIRRLASAGHQLTILAQTTEFDTVRRLAPRAELVAAGGERSPAWEDLLRTGAVDVLFCPLLVLDPLDAAIPSVVMIPDIQHEYYPGYFSKEVLQWRRRNYLPSAVSASAVLAMSESARHSMVERYGIPAAKVVLLPHDVDPEFHRSHSDEADRAVFASLALPEKYLYFPANFWPHKNHDKILAAFQMVCRQGYDHLHLVLTGAASAERDRVVQRISDLGLRDRVRVLDYQEIGVVAEIYRHAAALLFATEFEGFGTPILEAMNLGVPVITSRDGATGETAGGAAMLVDYRSPDDIARGCLEVLRSAALRLELVEAGQRRAAEFSWDWHMAEFERVLERITHPGFSKPGAIQVDEYPKISIVTPSFQMAPYIEQTIQSVLSQDYPHLEYVVMDGASTDGTVEILKKYGDRLAWRSEPDEGQADAVNKGFLASNGAVFSFLNADDTYRPGALAAIGNAFRKNPRAGLIYGEAYHVDERGEILCRYETLEFDYARLNYQCFLCQPAAFVARAAFARAGMLDTTLHYGMDHDLWIRLGAEEQVVKLPDYLAHWRMSSEIKSLRAREAVYQEAIATVGKHYGYVPFPWWNGLACYRMDRKDQFFERSVPTRRSELLALWLGLRGNPGQRRRYLREWLNYAGLGGAFEGRWEDGFVSARHRQILTLKRDTRRLVIEGRHITNSIYPLRMVVRLDGEPIGETTLQTRGPFQLSCDLPETEAGRQAALLLEFDHSWQAGGADMRHRACVIDSVRQERHPASRRQAGQ